MREAAEGKTEALEKLLEKAGQLQHEGYVELKSASDRKKKALQQLDVLLRKRDDPYLQNEVP